MNINEINNSQVTINNYNIVINDNENDAITNETTFGDLVKILCKYPEAMEVAQMEAKIKRNEEKLAKMREILGEDIDEKLFADEVRKHAKSDKEEKFRRPGAIKLRQTGRLLAMFPIGEDGKIEVYTNAYGIYDNGDRKAVIWIPACGHAVYQFTPLREDEKLYMSEYFEISEDVMSKFPWYNVLTLAGENKIEFNLTREKNRGTASDADTEYELEAKMSQGWSGCARFEDPETAYLRKEAREERLAMLTDRQREAYLLYYEKGYTVREVAEILGLGSGTISDCLGGVRGCFKKNIEKIF